MADVQRPALAPVLAALLDVSEGTARILAGPGALRIDEAGTCPAEHWLAAKVRYPWTTRDPAEAWEILDARGLLPPDGARSFDVGAAIADIIRNAPPRSRGNGGSRGDAGFIVYDDITARLPTYAIERGDVRVDAVLSDDERDERFTVEGALAAAARQWPHPATIPDLVAWASLGAEAIVTAEALCREIVPALARVGVVADRCERVVWRVRDASQGVRGPIVDYWQRRDGTTVLMADGTLDVPNGFSSFMRETIAPVRALWDMGLALERVGAECVVCVPPIGGSRG